jgi:hypothetical protein
MVLVVLHVELLSFSGSVQALALEVRKGNHGFGANIQPNRHVNQVSSKNSSFASMAKQFDDQTTSNSYRAFGVTFF